MRRGALMAAVLLLGGCDTLIQHGAVIRPLARSTTQGGASLVVARVIVAPGGGGQGMLAAVDLARYGGGVLSGRDRSALWPFAMPPTHAAGAEGWTHVTLAPGHYVLRMRAAHALADGGERRFAVTVPQTPATLYLGTFQVLCAGLPAIGGCRIAAEPADETEAAAAMLAANAPGAGAPVRALARPYPPALGTLGIAPPGVAELRVDAAAWMAAIDWEAVAAAMRRPASAPADGPRSEGWPAGTPAMRSVSMDFGSSGSGAGIIFLPAAIMVALPVALVIRLAIQGQREHSAAQAARTAEEARAAMEAARSEWGECAAGIAATLAPEPVERHLRATIPWMRGSGVTWQATVRRALLRQCGEAGANRHGVEVTTRWTAQRGGTGDPVFDAMYTRGVAAAMQDPRLVHSTRPAWELPVASEAACRPLADYCGAGGSALLLQEVTRGVTEARDAIGAGR
jgi:hypothetical protein